MTPTNTQWNTEVLQFIETQVGIKLHKLENRFRKHLTIMTENMHRSDLRIIASLGLSSGRYEMVPNGCHAVALVPIKKGGGLI